MGGLESWLVWDVCVRKLGRKGGFLVESPKQQLGGGFKYSYFHPYLGKISNLTDIFFKWVGSTTNQSFFLLVNSWYRNM